MVGKKDTQVGDALLGALEKVLSPLVRILLRYGVTYQAFEDVSRRVFIDTATRDFAIPGRKLTASRISVLTGLSRRNVARYRDRPMPHDGDDDERVNRAARVVAGWRTDPNFRDNAGRPRSLEFESGPDSFTDLVHRHAGDVPARALLDELMRVDAVERLGDARIRLIARAYIAGAANADTVAILGAHVPELIGTIDHNLEAEPNDTFFQRRVFFSGIPAARSAGIRELVRAQGQELLERLRDEFSAAAGEQSAQQGVASTSNGNGGGDSAGDAQRDTLRIVLGMHYFEEPDSDGPDES